MDEVCQWCQKPAPTCRVAQLDVCEECTPVVEKQVNIIPARRNAAGKWALRARLIVGRIAEEHRTDGPVELRARLSKAYPFGPRKYWPYKVWLDVVRETIETRGEQR